MEKNKWWDAFIYGSFIGILAGITIGFLMWKDVDKTDKYEYIILDEREFEFKN